MIKPGIKEVIGVIGLKGDSFIQDISGPGIEPWFVIDSGRVHLLITKDAKSFYETSLSERVLDPMSFVAPSLAHYDLPHRWSDCVLGSLWAFFPEEQVLVTQAIKRYVAEMASVIHEC